MICLVLFMKQVSVKPAAALLYFLSNQNYLLVAPTNW